MEGNDLMFLKCSTFRCHDDGDVYKLSIQLNRKTSRTLKMNNKYIHMIHSRLEYNLIKL